MQSTPGASLRLPSDVRWFTSAMAMAWGTLAPGAAWAVPEPPRICIGEGASSPTGQRLAAEAEAAGMRVVPTALGPAGSDALVAVHPGRIEIQIDGRTEVLEGNEPAALALSAVERLRSRLLVIELPPNPAAQPRPAPVAERPPRRSEGTAERPRATPATRAALLFDLGAASHLAAGGLPPSTGARLGGRFASTRWSAGVDVLIPIVPTELAEAEAEAEVSTTVVAIRGGRALTGLDAVFRPEVAVAAGLVLVSARGEVAPPLLGRDETLLAGLFAGELSGVLRVSHAFGVRAALALGLTAPRPTLRFEGRDVAHVGRWFGYSGLMLETNLSALFAPEPAEGRP